MLDLKQKRTFMNARNVAHVFGYSTILLVTYNVIVELHPNGNVNLDLTGNSDGVTIDHFCSINDRVCRQQVWIAKEL